MKNLKKYILSALCIIGLLLSSIPSTAYAINQKDSNTIYNKYNNFDLQNYSVIYNNGDVTIRLKTKKNFKCSVPNLHISKLNSLIAENKSVKNSISSILQNGNKIVGLSVTERYFEEIFNKKTQKTSYRFLTTNEVKEFNNQSKRQSKLNSTYNGQSQKKGKLTLTSLLVTDPNMTGEGNVYHLVGNASWDVPFLHICSSGSSDFPAVGEDFIGLCWPNNYSWLTGDFKGFYNNNMAINSSIKDMNSTSGAVWQFEDKIPTGHACIMARNITSFARIKKVSYVYGPQTFKVQYVHTYSKYTPSVNIGVSSEGVSGGLSISNVDKQWTITSPVTIY